MSESSTSPTGRNLVALCILSLAASAAAQQVSSRLSEEELARVLALQEERVELIARCSAAYVRIGGGSGVVVTPEGVMLTNQHVVSFQKEFTVSTPGGHSYKARVLGNDTRGDVSALQIELEEGETIPCCPMGDSDDLVVGEEVFAMGNPFSFAWDASPTISMGIVSAFHRNQGGYSDAIQTDAPINPGNSGGPLLNLKGEVIGINGRVATAFPGRWNTSIAFAIPVNQIKRFLPAFREASGGRVSHGTILGLEGAVNEHNGGRGARVTQVDGLSRAEEFGFHVGDTIRAVDGMPTPTYTRLLGVLGTYPIGAEVEVLTERKGQDLVLVAKIEKEKGPPPEGTFVLGIEADLQAEGKGVVVSDVLPGYGAEEADLHADDRILKVNGTEIGDVAALAAVIERLAGEGKLTVTLALKREGSDLEIPVSLRPYRE